MLSVCRAYDSATNAEVLELPPRAAGLRAKVDLERLLVEQLQSGNSGHYRRRALPLSAMTDDPQSEVNQLNENGITNYSNIWPGLRLWGNFVLLPRRPLPYA